MTTKNYDEILKDLMNSKENRRLMKEMRDYALRIGKYKRKYSLLALLKRAQK